MKFLADALKAKSQLQSSAPALPQSEEPESIIKYLMKSLGGTKKERSHKTVHASDLTKPDFCARRYALLDILKENPKDRYIEPALQATFDVGNATGDLVREQWLRDQAVGDWRCRKCNKIKTFAKHPGKEKCNAFHHCEWVYEEVQFFDPIHQYSGSLDILLDLGEPKLRVVELKIMAVDQFEKLKGPLAEHRIRTALYLNLVESSSHAHKSEVNTDVASVLYVSRGYGKKHPDHGVILPFKEFMVTRDDEGLIPLLNRAKEVADWRGAGIMPAQTCETSFCKRANRCEVRAACFSGKYPSLAPKPM